MCPHPACAPQLGGEDPPRARARMLKNARPSSSGFQLGPSCSRGEACERRPGRASEFRRLPHLRRNKLVVHESFMASEDPGGVHLSCRLCLEETGLRVLPPFCTGRPHGLACGRLKQRESFGDPPPTRAHEDFDRFWAGFDQLRPISAQDRLDLSGMRPTLTNTWSGIGRVLEFDQHVSEFDQIRPDIGKHRLNLARHRPTLARKRINIARNRPILDRFRPSSARC